MTSGFIELTTAAVLLGVIAAPNARAQWNCSGTLCLTTDNATIAPSTDGTGVGLYIWGPEDRTGPFTALQVSDGYSVDSPVTALMTNWSNSPNIVQLEGSNGQTNWVNDYLLLSREFNANVTVAPGGGVGIRFDIYNASQAFEEAGEIAAVVTNVGSHNTTALTFSTESSTSQLSEAMRITGSGNVGIGTTNPVHPLQVAGTIGAEEVIVSSNGADYVLEPGYEAEPLADVAAYIGTNHHLPGVPSAAEMKDKGLSVGEMQTTLLAKIEELTLHMISLEEQNRELRSRVIALEGQTGAGSR